MARTKRTTAARSEAERLLRAHGVDDFQWIDPKRIVTAQWVRMKCMFGCGSYGRRACCPPNTPTVTECERFLREYEEAVLFRAVARFETPKDRVRWNNQVNRRLSALERELFVAGHERVFLLSPATCTLCSTCTGDRSQCAQPLAARPSPEAMAVDVYSTARRFGYPIEVRQAPTDEQNRYGLLLIR
jgi:predicted metal-binding protein